MTPTYSCHIIFPAPSRSFLLSLFRARAGPALYLGRPAAHPSGSPSLPAPSPSRAAGLLWDLGRSAHRSVVLLHLANEFRSYGSGVKRLHNCISSVSLEKLNVTLHFCWYQQLCIVRGGGVCAEEAVQTWVHADHQHPSWGGEHRWQLNKLLGKEKLSHSLIDFHKASMNI